MKVVVLVTYLLTGHGSVEGAVCSFGFAAEARGDVWEACRQFQLQQSVTERTPPGFVGQVFACELRDDWPDEGRCFSVRTD
jgi:hypothetical protein